MKYTLGKAFTECCRPNPKTSKVSQKEFDENWERTFGKKDDKKQTEKRQPDDTCTTKKQ